MGVEVKGAGDGVVIADRGRNDCYNRNSGWGSGWGAVGGALVGGGFGAAAVSVWDKINDTKADIQKVESTVQEAKAGIYKDISDAARGVTQEISGVAKDVAGVGREILNNRFTTERGLCDLGYKTNSDIRDSRDQMGAGFNRVMDRLCNMEHQQSDCCCETKGLIKEVKSDKENGTALFEELRYGTYYIKEIKAPKDYELSSRVAKVEINDRGIFVDDEQVEEKDGTIEFTFENKKIEVPKTGD